MNYKEQYEKAKEMGLNIISLEVANEIKCFFDFELSDYEFESCCSLVEESYLKSEDLTILQFTRALYDMIIKYVFEEKRYDNIIELVNNTTRKILIDNACYYE